MAPRSIPPLADSERRRFLRFLKRDATTGCLVWIGSRNNRGYGEFRRAGKRGARVYAHRVAFLEAGGVLTAERPDVLHDCPAGDNPACCEPAHLRAGSHHENMLDREAKGRGRKSVAGLPRGVRRSRNGKFCGHVTVAGCYRHLGTFDTPGEAAAAVVAAEAGAVR